MGASTEQKALFVRNNPDAEAKKEPGGERVVPEATGPMLPKNGSTQACKVAFFLSCMKFAHKDGSPDLKSGFVFVAQNQITTTQLVLEQKDVSPWF